MQAVSKSRRTARKRPAVDPVRTPDGLGNGGTEWPLKEVSAPAHLNVIEASGNPAAAAVVPARRRCSDW